MSKKKVGMRKGAVRCDNCGLLIGFMYLSKYRQLDVFCPRCDNVLHFEVDYRLSGQQEEQDDSVPTIRGYVLDRSELYGA